MRRAIFFCTIVACLGPDGLGAQGRLGETALAEFANVDGWYQVVGARCAANRVVVAERSTSTVSTFDLTGEPKHRFGAIGSGPGEYRELTWVDVAGADLVLYDRGLRRITRVEFDGRNPRSSVLSGSEFGAAPKVVGVDARARVIFSVTRVQSRARGTTIRQDTLIVLRETSAERRPDSLFAFPGYRSVVSPYGNVGEFSVSIPFYETPSAEASGEFVFVSDPRSGRLLAYRHTSLPVQQFTVAEIAPRALTRAERSIVSEGLRRASSNPGAPPIDEILSSTPVPDSAPVFGWMGSRRLARSRRHSNGDVWFLLFGTPNAGGPTWLRVSRDGRRQGTIRADQEIDVLDSCGSAAVVLIWDSDGTERVQLRNIER